MYFCRLYPRGQSVPIVLIGLCRRRVQDHFSFLWSWFTEYSHEVEELTERKSRPWSAGRLPHPDRHSFLNAGLCCWSHAGGKQHSHKLLLTFSGFLCHRVTVSPSVLCRSVTSSSRRAITAVFLNVSGTCWHYRIGSPRCLNLTGEASPMKTL